MAGVLPRTAPQMPRATDSRLSFIARSSLDSSQLMMSRMRDFLCCRQPLPAGLGSRSLDVNPAIILFNCAARCHHALENGNDRIDDRPDLAIKPGLVAASRRDVRRQDHILG